MEGDAVTRRAPFATPFGRQVRPAGSARGTMLSALLHAVVIALLLWKTGEQFVDANRGLGADLGRGGGGGGGARTVAMFAVPGAAAAQEAPPALTPAPPPITVPQEMPTSIPEPTAQPTAAPVVAAAPGPGEGAGAGTGTGPGTGTGSGTGGGSGGGVGTGTGNDSGPGGGGGTVFPPSPVGILIPPTEGKPRELHGVVIRVTFRISERGEVVSVVTDPQIRDRSYRNEFLDRMKHYTFTPARTRDGQAVASEIPIYIKL